MAFLLIVGLLIVRLNYANYLHLIGKSVNQKILEFDAILVDQEVMNIEKEITG